MRVEGTQAGSRSTSALARSVFNYAEMVALLPHRYPFRFVDRVVEFEDGVRIVALKNVSVDEPFFPGHFPEQPLMPGVLICEALAQTGAVLAHRSRNGVPPGRALLLVGLDRVRFRRPVVPGDQLFLEVKYVKRRGPLWKLHGTARVSDQIVAEADMSAMEIERTRRP
jgi:3-hydroxyacyl-[acyl-carrier-protein] dehydratase